MKVPLAVIWIGGAIAICTSLIAIAHGVAVLYGSDFLPAFIAGSVWVFAYEAWRRFLRRMVGLQ